MRSLVPVDGFLKDIVTPAPSPTPVVEPISISSSSLVSADLVCTDGFPVAGGWGSDEEKCVLGNTLNDGNIYVYNENRGTEDAACGEDADCWCCYMPVGTVQLAAD